MGDQSLIDAGFYIGTTRATRSETDTQTPEKRRKENG